jgi:hypothetical protein
MFDVNTTVGCVIKVLRCKLLRLLLPHILRVNLTLPYNHVLGLAHEHLLLVAHVLSHLPLVLTADILCLIRLSEVGQRLHRHLHQIIREVLNILLVSVLVVVVVVELLVKIRLLLELLRVLLLF